MVEPISVPEFVGVCALIVILGDFIGRACNSYRIFERKSAVGVSSICTVCNVAASISLLFGEILDAPADIQREWLYMMMQVVAGVVFNGVYLAFIWWYTPMHIISLEAPFRLRDRFAPLSRLYLSIGALLLMLTAALAACVVAPFFLGIIPVLGDDFLRLYTHFPSLADSFRITSVMLSLIAPFPQLLLTCTTNQPDTLHWLNALLSGLGPFAVAAFLVRGGASWAMSASYAISGTVGCLNLMVLAWKIRHPPPRELVLNPVDEEIRLEEEEAGL